VHAKLIEHSVSSENYVLLPLGRKVACLSWLLSRTVLWIWKTAGDGIMRSRTMSNELGSRDRCFSMRKCVVLSEIWKVTKSYLLRHCRLHLAQHPTMNFLFMNHMRTFVTRLIRLTPQSSKLQRREGGFTRLNQADLLQQEVDDHIKAKASGAGVEDVVEARAFRTLNLRNGRP
jgi:hypothetical protein